MSFAKNIRKDLSNKCGLDSAKKSSKDAIETASKRAIQKTAEKTGDLIGNKIADKITSVSKISSVENSKELQKDDANNETEAQKRDTHLQKKGSKVLMN